VKRRRQRKERSLKIHHRKGDESEQTQQTIQYG
jgi:hypothetical protein